MTSEERKSILFKPCLSASDIMAMEDCKCQNAQRIMTLCRQIFNGSVPANKHRITTDSYLQYCGCPQGTWLQIIRSSNDESK